MNMSDKHAAAAYVRFYGALSPDTVSELKSVVHEDVRFKDPFSDVIRLDAYAALLEARLETSCSIFIVIVLSRLICGVTFNVRPTS